MTPDSDSFSFGFGAFDSESDAPKPQAAPAPQPASAHTSVTPPPTQSSAQPQQPGASAAGEEQLRTPGPDGQADEDSVREVIDAGKKVMYEGKNCCQKMCSLSYWQHFFDLDVGQFGRRLSRLFVFWKSDFFSIVGNNPDIWSWLWIGLTIVLLVVAMLSLSQYIRPDDVMEWDRAIWCMGIVFIYDLVLPIIAWLVFKLFGSNVPFRPTHMYCLYGYAMGAYIPVGILAIINIDLVTYIAWAILTLFSILFIIFNFNGYFKQIFEKKMYWIFIILFAVLHLGMAFMLLFLVLVSV